MKQDLSIRAVHPELHGGRYYAKTEIDREFTVNAFIHGVEPDTVICRYKYFDDDKWSEMPMFRRPDTHAYTAVLSFKQLGWHKYTVEAYKGELSACYDRTLEVFVNPHYARFSTWYEMFGRSQGTIPDQHATLTDMENRLPEIARMGFDVMYLVPIHPVGRTNRKGKNNSLEYGPDDPGCPWSIGNEHGDHKAIDPAYGTLEDFKRFTAKCKKYGMEVALDIALTTSPDHPWVKQHPNWFFYRPDGTIVYAENPPKKYEDTYPLNFFPPDKDEMWQELKSIFIHWREHGVRIFRIDNPHTKPTEFWEWCINEVKREYPDVIFLSEAFTAYEKLEELAVSGFDQSYTYFTWRNGKNELMEYCTKVTTSYLKEFFRANFFVNTPDILPTILQNGGRPAFKMRYVLAATLSSAIGMYNGYELCENRAVPGKEEYIDSEKYEFKVWDWHRPGNIKEHIANVNRIRHENKALHIYDNLKFYNSVNDNVLFYGKATPDCSNIILCAVNVDPFNTWESRVTVPLEEFGIPSDATYRMENLITGETETWHGRDNYVTLDPHHEPAYIYRLEI